MVTYNPSYVCAYNLLGGLKGHTSKLTIAVSSTPGPPSSGFGFGVNPKP